MQHLQRWVIPRSTYPAGRQGYKQWRCDLAKFHTDTAETILRDLGYEEAIIARVRSLLRKRRT